MRTSKWLIALVAIMATGLIAAGCGDDDESTTAAAETTSTSEETTSEDTSTSDGSDRRRRQRPPMTSTTPASKRSRVGRAESAGQTICEQARDGFEQCASQAEGHVRRRPRAIVAIADMSEASADRAEPRLLRRVRLSWSIARGSP